MHAFEVLADPVRRRLLELLAAGEVAAGELTEAVRAEFGISQPAVSQHLRVLRESGFAVVRPAGARRLYAVRDGAYDDIDAWLARYRTFWRQRLDALDTEIARGRRASSTGAGAAGAAGPAAGRGRDQAGSSGSAASTASGGS